MERTHNVWYAEAWAGTGVNAAHLNLAIGLKGSPVEQALLTAMAAPQQGVIPFFTVLQPNWPVKPFTLFVNKADFRSELHSRLTWGPAQAGIAEGMLTAVQRGLIGAERVDDYLAIVSVWVDWNADSDEEVYQNNKDAMLRAVERAFSSTPDINELLSRLGNAQNPFLKRTQEKH